MIRFEHIGKRYRGGIAALSDITFHVKQGELIVLTGHSGAGKSTLLNLIAAIERPSGGSVFVGGQDVGRIGRRGIPYLRRKLGLIFQDQKILFDRPVIDNVMLPLHITGYAPKDAPRRARAALDKVGLLAREKAAPITLSGGEQQRLAIARAIVNRPAILIADEPTAHLDADYARDIAALFQSFNQVGVTVIIATHDQSLFAPMASRVLHLSHGRLAESEAAP
jgi:cell division transport system ATP-binding protein